MATAVDPVRAEPIAFPPVAAPPIPVRVHRQYHWTRWAVAIGLVVALAIAGQLWRTHSQNAITYETVPLERGVVQASVTATGAVNAVVDVQVGSQVSGNIKALYADFNTKVTKGQLVALIDPAVFQTQVDQAQAALGSAQSAVLTAAAQVQKSTSDLAGKGLRPDRLKLRSSIGQRFENPGLLLFPCIPELFFRRRGTDSVNARLRAGGWRRENSKELQIMTTDVS